MTSYDYIPDNRIIELYDKSLRDIKDLSEGFYLELLYSNCNTNIEYKRLFVIGSQIMFNEGLYLPNVFKNYLLNNLYYFRTHDKLEQEKELLKSIIKDIILFKYPDILDSEYQLLSNISNEADKNTIFNNLLTSKFWYYLLGVKTNVDNFK